MRERRRYQKGSLKAVVMDGVRVWKAQWRDEGLVKRSRILGRCADLAAGRARAQLDEILRPINARVLNGQKAGPAALVMPMRFQQLVEEHYYPYGRKKWKEDSTRQTTEQRINYHLISELGAVWLNRFTRQDLQGLLDRKAGRGLSFSVVDHLHRDMKGIFQFALDEGLLLGTNPAGRLVTPREAARPRRTFLSEEQVRKYLLVLERRERLLSSLVLFSGFRPGEAMALKLGDHHHHHIHIARRLYKGSVGSPKNDRSERPVGLGPRTEALLREWEERLHERRPDAWLFPSENRAMPMWVNNCWRRNMKPRLDTVGLGWANFQVLRRTHSTLSNKHGNDPKVTSDQMGNGIGVNLDVYTQSDLSQRIEAATRLETEVLARPSAAVCEG